MRWFISVVLYTALVLGANAQGADPAAIAQLREGSMRKLTLAESPQPVPQVAFTDAQGRELHLGDWSGKHVLVNFWATWCAPCRKELPALDALNRDLGGETFEVVTIAVGRNPLPAIERLFSELGVEHLPVYLDTRMELARAMGVLGLPVTVILDPQGREIARMTGDAEWDSDSARAIVAALTADADSAVQAPE
ncbi:thiol-disulfide isomerase/thioredoxin [Albidovulum inexpectatum]|uniref:Thiol-disulfide isomerase/thioredoxin n=1 Tax=Albidovulum inexpectatum TaxID=196587 RepID=A0A2S5JGB9_9RHOB|nr:TlpA disulfide reductase family protein [Albidovulum inexpectatum]PPB80532.1 thiol-disulfide isomerase/thioredoxin [Albidovulum inexpectatum]